MKVHVTREAYEALRSVAVDGSTWEEWSLTTEIELDREVLIEMGMRRAHRGETLSQAIVRAIQIGEN